MGRRVLKYGALMTAGGVALFGGWLAAVVSEHNYVKKAHLAVPTRES